MDAEAVRSMGSPPRSPAMVEVVGPSPYDPRQVFSLPLQGPSRVRLRLSQARHCSLSAAMTCNVSLRSRWHLFSPDEVLLKAVRFGIIECNAQATNGKGTAFMTTTKFVNVTKTTASDIRDAFSIGEVASR